MAAGLRWCRNLLANPEVSVELEGRHFGGRAVLVADEDLRQKISELKYGNQRSLEPRIVAAITPIDSIL